MDPYHSSSSAGSSHAYGSLNPSLSPLGLTQDEWEDLARPLAESQPTNFSQSDFVPPTNVPSSSTQPSSEIPSSSVGPSSAGPSASKKVNQSKSTVWKYFDKVQEDGVRKAKCKICQDVYYL